MEDSFNTVLLEDAPCRLAPGQSRPLAFILSLQSLKTLRLLLRVTYAPAGSSHLVLSPIISCTFSPLSVHEPHKLTFLHPGGIVSYAILRAPSPKVAHEVPKSGALPILLNLHGAGLEAESQQVRHMLDPVPDLRAWVLFPTGVTPWSADDWRMSNY